MNIINTSLRINGSLEVIDYVGMKLKSIKLNDVESLISNFFTDYELSENWRYSNLGSTLVEINEVLSYDDFSLKSIGDEPENFIKNLYKVLYEIDENVEIEVTFIGSEYDIFGAMVLKDNKISQKKLYGIEVPQPNDHESTKDYEIEIKSFINEINNKKLEYLKMCHKKHDEYEYEWI